jgi:CRISPR-associated protein Cmx8
MAKSTNKAPSGKHDQVTITYDLFELPTAQHKAGLAGLLLQIDYMSHRRPKPPVPRVVERSATHATIEFTEETVQSLMDNLYDADPVKITSKTKWPNAKSLGEDFVEEKSDDGKTKRVKVFTYEVCQPKGHFLRHYFGEHNEIWHKLWRDMLWQIPRGNPQSRQPFEQCANDQPCKEGAAAWADLRKVAEAQKKNSVYITPVAGSLWLGAQAFNAESVPFEGRAEQNLLLHFWPLTSLVYVPQAVEVDGGSQFVGFVLAIPEVTRLGAFLTLYPLMLEGLTSDRRGYRPAEAVIDLPAEGALSFFEHLARLAADKASTSDIQDAVGAIEYLHLAKVGNNIKTMATGRISPRPNLLEAYLAITGRPGEKPPYGNPLFRRGMMRALLDEQPWYQPFAKLFAEWPHRFFVATADVPKLPWFWADARKRFEEVKKDMPNDPHQSPPDPNDKLAELIYRLVRTYLSVKAKEKSGIDPEAYKKGDKIEWDKVPQKYKDDRRQIAETLFMEYRSRREQAFLDQFVARLGAVKQFISEDDFLAVSRALMNQCDDVKTLTLLALSANS